MTRITYPTAKRVGTSNIVMVCNLLYVVLLPKSSSSCRAASTDIPDPLSPLLPIIHRLRPVFTITSYILT